ncbi:MAG: hypothetical protein IPK82_13500 [Polyangiaceae bacterium]|nr:hypothetical protein [Polyangiaceae bacterium]
MVTKLGNKDDPAMALDLAALGECLQFRNSQVRRCLPWSTLLPLLVNVNLTWKRFK